MVTYNNFIMSFVCHYMMDSGVTENISANEVEWKCQTHNSKPKLMGSGFDGHDDDC